MDEYIGIYCLLFSSICIILPYNLYMYNRPNSPTENFPAASTEMLPCASSAARTCANSLPHLRRWMDATIEVPNSQLSLLLPLRHGYPIDDASSLPPLRIINGLCHVRISLLILGAQRRQQCSNGSFRYTVSGFCDWSQIRLQRQKDRRI